MYCPKCNTQIPDGQNYCPNCGAQVTRETGTVTSNYQGPMGEDSPILTMGILAVIFCELGIPGWILGSIGLKKANQYQTLMGRLSPKARTGRILSMVGRIVGIVMTVFWVIWLVAMVVLLINVR